MACALGTCVTQIAGMCAINNGGCSPQAMCIETNGPPLCACDPGFHGDGMTCDACSSCDQTQFVSQPCTPAMDTACMECSIGCPDGAFESLPCFPNADRQCSACTGCADGTYETAPCSGTFDTACAPCVSNCATCSNASDMCTSCAPGFFLSESSCISLCGNGIVDAGEMCDDGNRMDGDGCSSTCTVEPSYYCYGDPGQPSTCNFGSCIFEPATALPLGIGFAIDGTGAASAMGVTFSQRSTIYTTADVAYPMMIEADVMYSAPDVTFIGSRGSGLRLAGDEDEPSDSLRARLYTNVDLAAGTTIVDTIQTPFTPATGVPYHIRWVDDGVTATVYWVDLTNAGTSITFATTSSFHGGGDRAFVGGGDMAGLTVANIRVCSPPPLPVTSGLVAHYSAIPSWTAVTDATGPAPVSQWQDQSGNGNTLGVNGPNPTFAPGILNNHAALDMSGGAGLVTAPFMLTTDVTLFVVIQHNVPAQWGAIAHHGDRDTDWSMEQSGANVDPDIQHWQTNNDNTNMDLTLAAGTTYVMTGRFAGNARYFSSQTFDAAPPNENAIVDASHTITAGSKTMYVGTSSNGEASNAFIGELVYFNRALSDMERDQMIDYLRQLWRP